MSNYYHMKKKSKIGIREELLLSFALLTIIALGSVGIATGIFINNIGKTISTQTTQTLETQIQTDMMNKTYNFASIINTQLDQVVADVNGLAEAVNDVLSNPIEFNPRRSYYHVDMYPAGTILFNGTTILTDQYFPNNIPPNYHYDPGLDLNVSDSASHYLIYQNSYNQMGMNEYNLTGIHGDIINRTANLDPIFNDIWHKNPMYAWIYVEFALGIQRTFPYTGIDATVFGGNGNSFFDYKTEDWYIDAKAANGDIVWTAPYIDPYLGWMITISRAVYNGTETLSNLMGVIGIDIRLETINKTVGDISFLESGYGFLVDNEGNIISHPDVNFSTSEEDVSIQVVEPIDDITFDHMISLESGFVLLEKEGEIYYLSYAPIPIAGYSLGIIVPQSEVLKTVYVLENALNQRMRAQILTLVIIIAIIIGIVLFVGLQIANSVVRPIQKLTNLAMQLSTEDIRKAALKIDSNFDADMQQDNEIGDLTRAFKNLVLKVQEDAKEDKDHPEP